MDAPILDFFDEEGVINKETYMATGKGFEKMHLIEEYKISSALFIFYKNEMDLICDPALLEDFYTFSNGSNVNQCYIYDKKFVLAICPLGAPSAGGLMEELGFMGVKNFFACGSAGQIDLGKPSSELVLVEKAIRGEGFSYHYQKPSLYAETSHHLTEHIANFLQKRNMKFYKSTTWTTDAFYRETLSEVELRKKQGAVCVEMECSGLCAVAKFRGYNFAQLLYFSDAIKQEGWAWNAERKQLKIMVIKLMIDCLIDFCKKNKKTI